MIIEVRGARFVLHGPLDFYSATTVRGRIMPELLDVGRVELSIDVADVPYLSFEGLAVLVDLIEQAERRGGSLSVAGLTGQPARVVRLAGLHTVLSDAVSLPQA
jgi:anti-anti-sigma factor